MFENLKSLRESLGMNQKQFAAELGFPTNTYSNYENGIRDPRPDFWITIADKYHVSIDYLMGFTDNPKGTKYGGKSKLEEQYYSLDGHGKKVIDTLLEIEHDRLGSQPIAEAKKAQKIIPLFPAAAGPGEPVDGEAFGEYEVDAENPAHFAVKISGDSMEPELHDGEIVLCVKRIPQVGELAVMMVNGFLLVKQYITDGRNIYLRSINRNRKNLDMDIWATGNDTVIGYGTVIHRKIPLVPQN